MEPREFDALTKRLATRLSRRGVLAGLSAALMGAVGRRGGAGEADASAQATVATCGNVLCKNNPGKCKPGCVCCVASNGNSRCLPAGQCSWGQQTCPPERPYIDPTRGCVACRTANQCPPSVDPCRVAACTNGACGIVPGNEGSACDDGNACTGPATCQGGVCRGGAPTNCPAGPCETATCDPVTGCATAPKPAATPCDDGNRCNGVGTCDGAGSCVQSAPPVTCGPCQACNPATGTCQPDPSQVGTACSGTEDRCFAAFQCTAEGVCAGVQPTVCTRSDSCHDPGTCDPATGLCSNPVRENGQSCVHASNCIQGGFCVNGTCSSARVVECQDRFDSVCRSRSGSCSEATGQCEYPAFPVGTRCDSPESNPCTTSTCDGNGTCVRGPGRCNPECQVCATLENRCVDIPEGLRQSCDQNRGYCAGGLCSYPCGEDCKDACFNREDASGLPQSPFCCKDHLDANGSCCWRYDAFGIVENGVCSPSYTPCCADPACCEPKNECVCSFGRISRCC